LFDNEDSDLFSDQPCCDGGDVDDKDEVGRWISSGMMPPRTASSRGDKWSQPVQGVETKDGVVCLLQCCRVGGGKQSDPSASFVAKLIMY
jgi:hypothetical protein